ncbi:MAG: RDD family protein [Burkholderiaceae bacterium]
MSFEPSSDSPPPLPPATTEHVAATPAVPARVGPPLASLGARFVAQIIDNVIAFALAFAAGFALSLPGGADSLVGIGALLCWFGYHLLSDGLANGQSLGKRVMKIAVVQGPQRIPCSYGRSIVRNITLLFLGLFDWVFILGASRRRLGDHLADTEVIELRS